MNRAYLLAVAAITATAACAPSVNGRPVANSSAAWSLSELVRDDEWPSVQLRNFDGSDLRFVEALVIGPGNPASAPSEQPIP